MIVNVFIGVILILILLGVAGEISLMRKEFGALKREASALWMEIYDLKWGKEDGEGKKVGPEMGGRAEE